MTPTPALDAMRAKTREQDEAATDGPCGKGPDAALIAAFRTDAPRYEVMLGEAVDALESIENCADRAGVEIARAALAKIEEMARE